MKAWRGNDLSRDARASPMEGPDMAEQKKKETRPTKPNEGGGDGASASPEIAKKGKKIKEDIDKLLDEIDDILEENAEEFVKSYVQRGGE
jgi:prokaryotic ubiquitin-like protein Pup